MPQARGLADLPPVESDSLLALIAMANADTRPDKIDVGVGVFRDGAGNTPILKVIKEAERRLLETQKTKSYLGSAGDKRFAELLRPILLGDHAERRADRRAADAGRLRRAEAWASSCRGRQSGRAGAGRHADLAQPCADHPRGRARDRRYALLRPRPAPRFVSTR